MSTPGSKRSISCVSPASESESPCHKAATSQLDIDQDQSNMAAIEGQVNNATPPVWFQMYDKSLDDRIGALIETKLNIRLEQIEEMCETARSNAAGAMENARGAKDLAGEARDQVDSLQQTFEQENATLKAQIKSLETKINSLENYNRRENLKFDGIDESPHETTHDTTEKIYNILSTVLKLTDARQFKLQACHRVGHKVQGKPRSILIRFNWRADRDKVWQNRRELKGTKIFMREDFSVKTEQCQRKPTAAMKEA